MIDSIYFLSEIYELANIESYIVSNDKTKPIISLKNSKGLSLTNYLTKQKNEVPKLFNLDSNIFTTHHIKINNVASNNSFEILFFQDITSGQQRLSNTVLKVFFLYLY